MANIFRARLSPRLYCNKGPTKSKALRRQLPGLLPRTVKTSKRTRSYLKACGMLTVFAKGDQGTDDQTTNPGDGVFPILPTSLRKWPKTSLEQGMICVPYKEIIEEMIGSKCQQGISHTGQLVFPQNVRHKRSMQLCVALGVLLTASRSALMAAHGTSCLSRKG